MCTVSDQGLPRAARAHAGKRNPSQRTAARRGSGGSGGTRDVSREALALASASTSSCSGIPRGGGVASVDVLALEQARRRITAACANRRASCSRNGRWRKLVGEEEALGGDGLSAVGDGCSFMLYRASQRGRVRPPVGHLGVVGAGRPCDVFARGRCGGGGEGRGGATCRARPGSGRGFRRRAGRGGRPAGRRRPRRAPPRASRPRKGRRRRRRRARSC